MRNEFVWHTNLAPNKILKKFLTKNLFYLHEKVKALHFRCFLNMALLFFYVSKHHSVFTCEMFLLFYILYFFYAQLTFVFHLLRDFYIICKHIIIATFCHFLFFSSSEGFWHLLGAFLKFFFGCLVIFSWLFFKNIYLWKRFYVKKKLLKFGLRLFIVLLLSIFINHLRIT